MDGCIWRRQVLEWRKTGHALPCPVMPAYPTHVPSAKVRGELATPRHPSPTWG